MRTSTDAQTELAAGTVVRVSARGHEGTYSKLTHGPRSKHGGWLSTNSPDSMPLPDSTVARWLRKGLAVVA
jgi:hypothetical protein